MPMGPPSRDDPELRRLKRLTRLLTWVAAGVAGAVFIAIPVIFFATAYRYESLRIERTSENLAATLSEFVYAHPDLWKFTSHRLVGILRKNAEDKQHRRLLGLDGAIIAEFPESAGKRAAETPYRRSIHGRAKVFNGKTVVGTLHIVDSPSPILIATGWVALFSLALATAVFLILRLLPLRALDTAMGSLAKAHMELRTRIDELESTKENLERQSVELSRLAEDLATARDQANSANHAKSEFLTAMSHELRTPLNAIIGFSEMIQSERLGPVGVAKYGDYARDINESGQHLLALVNDILDLSKIEFGEGKLHEQTINIPPTIRSVLMLVQHRAKKNDIEIGLDIPDDLPALRADERKLKQILVNLLSNAIKFTDAGGKIMIRVWCRPDSGHAFQVIDTGIGIAPENIPKALRQFGQVDGNLNRNYDGIGLGLPLVQALIELHGGSLELESQLGVGTTATVRFPAARIVSVRYAALASDGVDSAVG